jgi:hypothetical protein
MLIGGLGGLGLIIELGLLVFCVFDIISTDDSRIQNLPKIVWLLIVIFLPIIGGLAWLLLGRPSNAELRPGSTRERRYNAPPAAPPPGLPERPPVSSEDHNARREETLKRYYEEREQEIRKREEDLRRREEEFRRKQTGEDA